MAVNEPPVDADLIDAGVDPGAVETGTEFWRNVLPWDDLVAKSPPGRYLQLQKDIIPTLAGLVAGRGPTGPKLIPADAAGRLIATGTPYFADVIAATANSGDLSFKVADVSLYSPGQLVLIPGFGPQVGGRSSDYVGRIGIVAQDFGKTTGSFTVGQSVPTTIPAGTPILVIAPQAPWLPPSPWQQPVNLPVTVSRVGAGAAVLVAGVAGSTVWAFTGVVEVTVAVAGAFVQLNDSVGNIRFQWSAAAVGNFPFDLGGAPLGLVGTGAQIAVAGGAATGIISLAYSQA